MFGSIKVVDRFVTPSSYIDSRYERVVYTPSGLKENGSSKTKKEPQNKPSIIKPIKRVSPIHNKQTRVVFI